MFANKVMCRRRNRRGVVVVQVAVLMVVLLGFAAIAIDMGALYNTKADLQNVADAAATAAAVKLADYSTQDPMGLAKEAAAGIVARNEVLNHSVALDPDVDVIFGRAILNEISGAYDFLPTEDNPDAVQVTVNKTSGSMNGPVSLFFANVFGKSSADVLASSTAMMVPRDIAIIADLSGSHTDDCELRHYKLTDVCLYDVWDALPGGKGDAVTDWAEDDFTMDAQQTAGPGWAHMREFGWGTNPITTSFDPTTDAGLAYLPRYSGWSNATINAALAAQGYIQAEIDALNSSANDSTSSYYDNRVAAALGLAQWNSGMAGGLWSKTGQPAGNNNSIVGSTELVWQTPLLSQSATSAKTTWLAYISYMRSTTSAMYYANSNFKYRYGMKTVTNYLMEKRPSYSQTPELTDTPTQPMQAVKDAVSAMVTYLVDLETDDQLSLEIYGTTAYHEVDLTKDYLEVSNRLNEMSAGYYDSNTNMGGGMEKGIEELTGSRSRPTAKKTMILLTDGIANVDENGDFTEEGGRAYALDQAQVAADLGIRIYAVSVGVGADQDHMAEIATIGGGEHFHAGADMDEYIDELQGILERLGGTRPVELIK